MGAFGSGLVDHAELKPHCLDAQPILLGNGLVDHGSDPLAVHEAVHDVNRARNLCEPAISLLRVCPHREG